MSIIKGAPHWRGAPVEDRGGPPHNGDMEAIRERLIKIETKLDTLTTIFATKADVSEAKFQIILWVVSAVFLAQLLPGLLRKFGL